MYLDKQFEFCSSQDFVGRPGSFTFSQNFVDIGLYQDIRGVADADHWATRMISRGEPIRILFNCEVAPTSGGVQVEVGMATDENGANWKMIGRSGRIMSGTHSAWAVGKSHVMILDPWSDLDRPQLLSTTSQNRGGERWHVAQKHRFLGLRVRRLFGGSNTGYDGTTADGSTTFLTDSAYFTAPAGAWDDLPITIHHAKDGPGTDTSGVLDDGATALETEIDDVNSTTSIELKIAPDFVLKDASLEGVTTGAYAGTSEKVGAIFTIGVVDFTMSSYLVVGEQTGTNLSIGT